MFNSNRKPEPPCILGSHDRQIDDVAGVPQGPGLSKTHTDKANRAQRLRDLCKVRHVSMMQLARHWGVCETRARVLVHRESGPPSEKLKLLPPTLLARIGGSK